MQKTKDPLVFPLPSDQFDRAVQLASAFVVNGDIRLEKDESQNTYVYNRLARLIADMYDVLSKAHEYWADKHPQGDPESSEGYKP